MAGGVPAGRLSIEIVAEIARLQQDLDKAKRAVNAASADIARSAKAANDNLAGIGKGAGSGVQQLSREFANLKAALDPAWAAQQKYNAEVELGQRAFKAGAIDREQFIAHMRQANAALKEASPAAQAAAAALQQEAQAQREAAQAAEVAARAAKEAATQKAAYAAQATSLRAQLDPMFAAQQRFNQAMDQADDLLRAGAITAREYGAAQALARKELQQHAQAVTSGAKAVQAATVTAGQQRAGTQQLAFNIQDIGVQMGMAAQSSKPFQMAMMSLSQQIPQVVSAVQLMTGASKGFIGFMGGPAGAVLMGTVTILGSLAMAYANAKDETSDAEKATRSFNEIMEDAKSSWVEVRKAAKDYADQQAKSRLTTLDQIAIEAKAIQSRLALALATRKVIQSWIEEEKLKAELAGQSGSAEALAIALKRQGDYQKLLENNTKAMADLQRDGREVEITLANALAQIASDPSAKLKAGFDALRNGARSSIKDVEDLAARLADLNRQETAALERLQQSHKATASFAKVTGQEIANILGTKITSGLRTATQNANAKGAKNSYHLTGQAIDIPLTVNGKPLTKAGIRSELEKAGIVIKELLGPGDKGHNDHFHIAFGLKRVGPDDIRKAQEEAGKLAAAAAKKIQDEMDRLLEKAGDSSNRAFGALWESTRDIQATRLADDLDRVFEQIGRDQAARTKPMEDAAQATADWNEQLDKTIDFLDQIGGKASKLGDIAALMQGISTGDFSKVGGPLGAIMESVGNTKYSRENPETGKPEIRLLREDMKDWLGENGTVIKALQGAGLGVAGSQLIFGAGNTNIGAAFGGALGKGFGNDIQKAVTKGVGGAFGEAAGKIAGAFAPVIGGILGNLVGSLMKSTPRGSATFNEQGLVSTRGNSDSRIAAATKLGGGVLDVLNQLAEQLGAGIGSASFSVGMRKKNFVLDPSGQGRTKGAGVINFGQDEEAALKAAIQDAISDGVFTGLSDGVQRLLNGEGDIEKQLQKALSLKGAMDSLAQRKDGQAFDLAALDKEFAKLRDIATEAGEGLAQVEELYGLKRKDIVDKYAQDALDKAREALEQENALSGLRVQILELEGKRTEALALARQVELSTLTDAEKALKLRIHQLQDEAEAATNAAEAAKTAKEASMTLTEQRRDLYVQITQMTDAEAALKIQREDELRAADASLRPLIQRIHALQDEAAAAEKAAKIADERKGLETQWLELIGDQAELRKRELAALDPSNRDLQQKIWDYADAKAAEAAALEQAQKAAEAWAKTMEDARGTLISAYERESSALQQTIDKMRDFAASIREFRQGLTITSNPAAGYGLSKTQFLDTSRSAYGLNEAAMGRFTSDAQKFLEQSLSRAATRADYQRDVALVAREAFKLEERAGSKASAAQRQIDAMEAQIKAAIGIDALNDNVISFGEALSTYTALQRAEMPVLTDTVASGLESVGAKIEQATQKAEKSTQASLADLKTALENIVISNNRIERLLSGWSDGDRARVAVDGRVEVEGTVSVTAYTGGTVPVEEQTP